MTPYRFSKYLQLKDEDIVLPPKKLGESYRFMEVRFPGTRKFRGADTFDIYARTIRYIGMPLAAKVARFSKIKRNGLPIIADRVLGHWPKNYKSFEIEGYHVLKLRATSYRAFLVELSETYNLGLEVTLL